MVEDESWYDEKEFLEWSRIVLEDESEKESELSDQEGGEPVQCDHDFERSDWEVWDEGGGREGSKYSEEDGL